MTARNMNLSQVQLQSLRTNWNPVLEKGENPVLKTVLDKRENPLLDKEKDSGNGGESVLDEGDSFIWNKGENLMLDKGKNPVPDKENPLLQAFPSLGQCKSINGIHPAL